MPAPVHVAKVKTATSQKEEGGKKVKFQFRPLDEIGRGEYVGGKNGKGKGKGERRVQAQRQTQRKAVPAQAVGRSNAGYGLYPPRQRGDYRDREREFGPFLISFHPISSHHIPITSQPHPYHISTSPHPYLIPTTSLPPIHSLTHSLTACLTHSFIHSPTNTLPL